MAKSVKKDLYGFVLIFNAARQQKYFNTIDTFMSSYLLICSNLK